MSVLIRMDNLGGGGGWQVAHSFLAELSGLVKDEDTLRRFPWLLTDLRISVTTGVADQMSDEILASLPITVSPPAGLAARALQKHSADVIFTLFGPAYGRTRATRRVAGCADVTSLYWDADGAQPVSVAGRVRRAIRRRISRRFFRRCDRVIVEAQHLARDLASRWRINPEKVVTVPNVLNGVFADLSPEPVGPPAQPARLCYITRAYPHKNLRLLGDVGPILRERYGLEVTFVLTLNESEWEAQNPSVRDWSTNVGPVAVADLPGIYEGSDGCVFPSKLEAFSTTPLEALATGTPLIASDRPFCRDLLEGVALFADPNSPDQWAEAIAETLNRSDAVTDRVRRGRELIDRWPTARERAVRYLEEIDQQVSTLPTAEGPSRQVSSR